MEGSDTPTKHGADITNKLNIKIKEIEIKLLKTDIDSCMNGSQEACDFYHNNRKREKQKYKGRAYL